MATAPMDLLICNPWGVRGCIAVGRRAAAAVDRSIEVTQAALLALRTPSAVLRFHYRFTLPPITLVRAASCRTLYSTLWHRLCSTKAWTALVA